MSRRDDMVYLSAHVIHTTPRAVRFSANGESFWVPRSLLRGVDEDDIAVGESLDFAVPRWFAEKEGLEE